MIITGNRKKIYMLIVVLAICFLSKELYSFYYYKQYFDYVKKIIEASSMEQDYLLSEQSGKSVDFEKLIGSNPSQYYHQTFSSLNIDQTSKYYRNWMFSDLENGNEIMQIFVPRMNELPISFIFTKQDENWKLSEILLSH